MATYSSIPAWKIPCTEEPGGLQSMGSQSRTRLSNRTCTREMTRPGVVESELAVGLVPG